MKAIYPGVFDPLTCGHLDVIERASKLFPKGLKIVLGRNSQKNLLFTVEERIELIEQSTLHLNNVEVLFYEGLIVEYLKQEKDHVIVRGLRAVSDFEYELQIASINQKVYDQAETIFLSAREHFTYLSSSLVKELASFHTSIKDFVTPSVEEALRKKFPLD